LTSCSVVLLAGQEFASSAELLGFVWPIALATGSAAILVMSALYHELRAVVRELADREGRATHLALHDQLTGLPNRALLYDRIEQAMCRSLRDAEPFALLMLDLDHFKQVNDTLGHQAGDLIVKQAGDRLSALLRQTDTVARIGGDEFAVLISCLSGKAHLEALCERILRSLNQPFELDGREAQVSVSIGAVIPDEPVLSSSELLRKADIALYNAKAAGRSCLRVFSEAMDAAIQRRDVIETRLRAALAEDLGLDLHYQPHVSRDGAVVGFECLLRWHDSVLGQVTPAEVVPIAEETGLIHSLGEWVFRRACETAHQWPHLAFSVNLSPVQFRAPDLAERLARIAAEIDVRCRQIELEITETLLVEHGDLCSGTIRELRLSGFKVSLDDFGTGYSSLSYLRHFEVDKIKLDRSFLDEADAEQTLAIVRAAVQLGRAMNLEIVAEGISTVEQEQIAIQAGCTGLQGFLYAPALPLKMVQGWLSRNASLRAA
jgi:diguanylate cyclase (GGDEF)-like protein